MKMASRTHYALKMLVDLAMLAVKQPAQVADIATRQAIPRQFLHQILLELKSSGIVKSRRGRHGAYMLAVPPGQISVAAVVRATQGDLLAPPQNVIASKNGVVATYWVSPSL